MCTLRENTCSDNATVWMKCNVCHGWLPSMSALRHHRETYHGQNKIISQQKLLLDDTEINVYTTYDTPYHRNTVLPQLPLSSIKVLSCYYPNGTTDVDTVIVSGLTSENSNNKKTPERNTDNSQQADKLRSSGKSDVNAQESVTCLERSKEVQIGVGSPQLGVSLSRLSRGRLGPRCNQTVNELSVNRISFRGSQNLRLASNDSKVSARPSDSDSSSDSDVVDPPKRKPLELTIRHAKVVDAEWKPTPYHRKPVIAAIEARPVGDSPWKLSTRPMRKTEISLRQRDSHRSKSSVNDHNARNVTATKRKIRSA